MLKAFFESPEIAVIFAAKERDKGSVDTNESSRLRVGKHTRKREHNTKRAVRSKIRGEQYSNCIDMFSGRKTKVDNDENVASLHEKVDYYDFDDETGTIVKKKHSVFDCGSKQSSLEYDKVDGNVDIKKDGIEEQVACDLSTLGDGYCPSDSAYDTNHDDYTGSLERIMIRDDAVAIRVSLADNNNNNESSFGKPLGKRESPYRRCRSSAICGRNCEICRGKNNNIMPPAKQKQLKNVTVEAVHKGPRVGKAVAFQEKKDSNVKDKINKKNCGMFSSKIREKNRSLKEKAIEYFPEYDSLKNRTSDGNDLQRSFEENGACDDTHLEETLPRTSDSTTSSSPISATSVDNIDGSDSSLQLHEEDYYREVSYSVPHITLNHGISNHTHNPAGSPDSGEGLDEHVLSSLGFDDDVNEAFIRGPHLVMLYDFRAEHEGDISVWKGEVVLLLDNRDRDWVWVGTETYNEGYVPRSLTAPYSYCEECRQEELRRIKILDKDEASSNASIPRSMSTNSRSSLGSIQSSRKCSDENLPLQQRQDSPTLSNISQSSTDQLLSENGLNLNNTSSYQMNNRENRPSYIQSNTSQPKSNSLNQTSTGDAVYFKENPTSNRRASSKVLKDSRSSPLQGQQSFESGNSDNVAPKEASAVSRKSSLQLNSPTLQTHKPNAVSKELIYWQRKEKERILKDGLKLVALSSYQSNEEGRLAVTAGDYIYVHLKDQKIPNWLWVYSPESDRFGFIPESVVDELKSSIV